MHLLVLHNNHGNSCTLAELEQFRVPLTWTRVNKIATIGFSMANGMAALAGGANGSMTSEPCDLSTGTLMMDMSTLPRDEMDMDWQPVTVSKVVALVPMSTNVGMYC